MYRYCSCFRFFVLFMPLSIHHTFYSFLFLSLIFSSPVQLQNLNFIYVSDFVVKMISTIVIETQNSRIDH